MFYSLVLRFYLEKNIVVTHHLGRGLHGMFYSLLRRCDADYAGLVHGSARCRPFTVSPLTVLEMPGGKSCCPGEGGFLPAIGGGDGKPDCADRSGRRSAGALLPGLPLHHLPCAQVRGGSGFHGYSASEADAGGTRAGRDRPVMPAGSLCRVRFTLLEDRPFLRLAEYFLGIRRGFGLSLAGAPVSVKEVLIVPSAEDPWAGHAGPADLYELAAASDLFTLTFASPTTFRRGDKNLPLPVPRLVFQGLYDKWQHFCPEQPLKEDLLDFVDRHIFPAKYHLVTDLIDYGKNALYSGFVGCCTFGLRRQIVKAYPDHARQVDLLARFAFFAGVGQKTTMGMGQCITDEIDIRL